jgi:hypothetical protein
MNRSRYPGPRPYSTEDESLFFGREEEKDTLISLIKTNKVTVLFGRSGFGKSSLIEAGIIPYFRNKYNYKIIEIRYENTLDEHGKEKLLQKQIIDNFRKNEITGEYFFHQLEFDADDVSLWQVFKTLQWNLKGKVDGILFIMDQFEQVFNFPETYYKTFAAELSEVIYNRVPLKFQNRLLERINSQKSRENKEAFLKNYKEEIDFIKEDIPISFLIGIRSDRLYFLDEIGEEIPLIFNNRFRLRRLNVDKIADVIRGPAQLPGNDYRSFPFRYSDNAIEKIKKYLSFNKVNPDYPKIETFQLQIICEYIELNIVKDKENFTVDQLPDLSAITQDYYKNIFERTDSRTNQKTFNDLDKLLIRFLIERKLIDRKTGNRICLDKIFVTVIGFDDALLDKLIETRIIRREPNTVSGQSIELSHDTLVEPIVRSSSDSQLGNLDNHLTDYYNQIIIELPKQYKDDIKTLEKKLVTDEGNLNILKEKDLPPHEREIIHKLSDKRIIIKDKENSSDSVYILNEVFQDVVIKKLKSLVKLTTLIKYISTITAALLIIAVITNYAIGYHKQLLKENAFNVALLIDINGKNSRSKRFVLALNEAYKKFSNKNVKGNDSVERAIVVKKLIDCFNNNLFLGKQWEQVKKTPLSFKLSTTGDSMLVLYNGDNPNNNLQTGGYGQTSPSSIDLNQPTAVRLNQPNLIYYALYDCRDSSIISIDTTTKIYDATFDYSYSSHIKLIKDPSQLENLNNSDTQYAIFYTHAVSPLRRDTAKNKTIWILYNPSHPDTISVNSKKYKTDSLLQGEQLTYAYFSMTGDTVFIATLNGNIFLFNVVNNVLTPLSKFYVGLNGPFSTYNGEKIKNVIPVIFNNALYTFDLRDPEIRTVNTTDPQKISDWIFKKEWTLTKADRDTLGLKE